MSSTAYKVPRTKEGRQFHRLVDEALRTLPLRTLDGMVNTHRVDVQFSSPAGKHELATCWEYIRNDTDLRMLFGFYRNFNQDDLICLALEAHENPKPNQGASIQFNATERISADLSLSHHGLVTVRTAVSRINLFSEIMKVAPGAAAELNLSSEKKWPITLGNANNVHALIDNVFLYVYAIEQAKRSLRKEPLLSTLPTKTSGYETQISRTSKAQDIAVIKARTDIGETEKEQLIKARRGQGIFRKDLLKHWNDRCAVTKCGYIKLLRASHIKPWAVSTDAERLDVYNGLLLTPNLDAAFDKGLISFKNSGEIMISQELDAKDAMRLGLKPSFSVNLTKKHRAYMKEHREKTFI